MSSLLNKKILVLNHSFLPVRVAGAKQVISNLIVGRVKVIDSDWSLHDLDSWIKSSSTNQGYLRSPLQTIPIPYVVIISGRNSKKTFYTSKPKLTKKNLFYRDRFTCQYCGKLFRTKELTIDHVIPKSKGGKTTWENIVTACKRCNTLKGNKDLSTVSDLSLLKKPKTPSYIQYIDMDISQDVYEYWKKFLL